jgi:hypothetical protein
VILQIYSNYRCHLSWIKRSIRIALFRFFFYVIYLLEMCIYHRLLSWFTSNFNAVSSNSELASVRPYLSFSLSSHNSSTHRCFRVAPLLVVPPEKSSRSALVIALRFTRSARQVSTDELMHIFFSLFLLFMLIFSFVSSLFSSPFFCFTYFLSPFIPFLFLCIFQSKLDLPLNFISHFLFFLLPRARRAAAPMPPSRV